MCDAAARPLPAPTEADTEDYWRACSEHRLTYQVDDAGRVVFHPRRHDPRSLGGGLTVRESAGAGTVYSYTVVRQHGHPYFRGRAPYVVAFVDLDEGFRVLAEVVAPPGEVRIGQRVRLDWEDHEDVAIPLFRPAP